MPRSFLIKKKEKRNSSRSWRKSYKDINDTHAVLPDLVYPTPVRVQPYTPRIPPVTVANGYVPELISHPYSRDQTSPALSVSSSHSVPFSVPSPTSSYNNEVPTAYNSPSPVNLAPAGYAGNYMQNAGIHMSSLYCLGMAVVNPVCPGITIHTPVSPTQNLAVPSPVRSISPDYPTVGQTTQAAEPAEAVNDAESVSNSDASDELSKSLPTAEKLTNLVASNLTSFQSMIPQYETLEDSAYKLTNLQQVAPFKEPEKFDRITKKKTKIWSPVDEIMNDKQNNKDEKNNNVLNTNVENFPLKCEGIVQESQNTIEESHIVENDITQNADQSEENANEKSGNDDTPFQEGVTVGYTYDAFFITDGRAKKRETPDVVDKKTNKYVCNECRKSYATSSNLSRHKQTHRSPEGEAAKKCPHCTKVYVSMPALSMHILTHTLKHVCDVCGKGFSRPWLLQGHKRSHSGEKPYGCAHCGKAFADRSNLRAHMQTHSTQKSYQCKRCHKSFALKSYLNKHYESSCLKEETMSLQTPSEA